MVSQQQTEFTNETLRITVEPLSGSRVALTVFVSPIATEAAYRKALKNVSKEVSIPGFRKGKAPESIILEQYSQYIDREWRDLVMRTALSDAIRLANIRLFDGSEIVPPRLVSCSREQGAEISATFERHPEAPNIDLSAISVQKGTARPVTAEDVEKAIEELQRFHAKWEAVGSRPVQDGDLIQLTADQLDAENNVKDRLCTEEKLRVAKDQLPEWLYESVLGQEINRPFEGTSRPNGSESNEAFTPITCRLVILSIEQQVLPPVDEALAKQAGCKDVEELRANIQKSLEQRAVEQVELEALGQLERQLLQLYPIEVPKSRLKAEVDSRTRSLLEGLMALNPEKKPAISEAKARQMVQPRAEAALQLLYLLDPMMRNEAIKVVKDDLVMALNQQRYMSQPWERIIHSGMKPEEIRQRLLDQIFTQKTLIWLLAQVVKTT